MCETLSLAQYIVDGHRFIGHLVVYAVIVEIDTSYSVNRWKMDNIVRRGS